MVGGIIKRGRFGGFASEGPQCDLLCKTPYIFVWGSLTGFSIEKCMGEVEGSGKLRAQGYFSMGSTHAPHGPVMSSSCGEDGRIRACWCATSKQEIVY